MARNMYIHNGVSKVEIRESGGSAWLTNLFPPLTATDRRRTPRGVLHHEAGWIKLQCPKCGSAFVTRLTIGQGSHYECLTCGQKWNGETNENATEVKMSAQVLVCNRILNHSR